MQLSSYFLFFFPFMLLYNERADCNLTIVQFILLIYHFHCSRKKLFEKNVIVKIVSVRLFLFFRCVRCFMKSLCTASNTDLVSEIEWECSKHLATISS